MIRSASERDAQSIVDIYNHYIVHSHATFELDIISDQEMISRIKRVQEEFRLPWLVMEIDNQVIGYAYATQWKARIAYSKTAESSIYLDKNVGGKGYGKILYTDLLNQLRDLDYHIIIGGMSMPNEASQALHENLGFEKVGEFKEVGFKFDRWIDVGYWQVTL